MKSEDSPSNISVICRFRPLTESEIEHSPDLIYSLNQDHKTLSAASQYESEAQKFTFDYIFDTDASQQEVYSYAAAPIVQAVMQGFNGTIFAYGQTSSGKTFTMTGPSVESQELMGITPRMILSIFDEISNSDPWIEYSVKVSYYEIYLEKLRDLLEPGKENLKIHEDKTRGIFISELTEKYVSNSSEVFDLLKFGLENRVVSATNMNQQSSRSHSLFCLSVSQTNKRDYISKTGKLYLVDLAGSEKVRKSLAVGQRLEEAKNINKSLTTLGLVIYSLTDGKSTHIPYRDSKLTRVLQDSLGGNSKTCLIITCSPSVYNDSETMSTLRFGARAKFIKNRPRINREFTIAELKIMLIQCREELAKKDRHIKSIEDLLKNSNKRYSIDSSNDAGVSSEINEINGYEEIIAELEDTRTKLSEEVKSNKKIKEELEEKENELNHEKITSEVVNKKAQDLKEKILNFEKILKAKDELIESLSVTKEALEKELGLAHRRILELEASLNEKEVNKGSPLKETKIGMDELKFLLTQEQEEKRSAVKENSIIRQSLNDILNKKLPESKIKEIFNDEAIRKAKERWDEEKRHLNKELLLRVNKIIEIEMELDNSKQKYKNLESMLSEGERALKKKTDILERNLEQLTVMYNQLTSQKSQLSVEKILAEKKLSRVSETIKNLQEDLENSKIQIESYQQKNEILVNEIQLIKHTRQKARKNTGNCVITISGGACLAKSASFLALNNL